MTEALATNSKLKPRSGRKGAVGRLFVLELSGGRIHSMSPDGSDRKVIVTGCHLPDGIAVDAAAGHIYWTNMGVPNLDDGSIERADLDGKNRRVIVPRGITHTPKQIHSMRKTASSIAAIARACEECARTSPARTQRRWARPAAEGRTGAIR